MRSIITILLLISLINCSKSDNNNGITNTEDDINFNLGISFPPVADEEQRSFAAPLLNELNVNIIRIGEKWSFREPSEGNFNWASLDQRINWAENNGLNVLLTIQSNGPDWACSGQQNTNSCVFQDNEKFKNYIEALLQRYPNKISKIQFGNEWQSTFWYIGSAENFVTANNIVYNAIQQFSPETEFVLGGFTTISLRFLVGCNGLVDEFYDDEGNLYDRTFLDNNCNTAEIQDVVTRIEYVLQNANYDMVDMHLYDDAENWIKYFENFQTMVQKPIIITEFGGPNVNIEPISEDYQSERLEVYIKTIDSLDVEEAYFFKLVEGSNNPAHAESGLINNPELTKKINYSVFKRLNN
ncbi:glycosyl hydrolase [uncultured Winogradskyella sp.]|uniref:glycosyl hydrolase n=1 Tax=uncultured Winogradskyella sp. TaxID=395353 RepID=UPI0026380A4A|nr:glycosyl hydrolase [uncultured Winogradskyella sp.]